MPLHDHSVIWDAYCHEVKDEVTSAWINKTIQKTNEKTDMEKQEMAGVEKNKNVTKKGLEQNITVWQVSFYKWH